MKKILLALGLALPLATQAQTDDSTISLDLLRAPASPAFNMLGIAPSVIERPTDLNAFRVSIQNASSNFTHLPSSYAVDVAPAALARMRNQTLDKFNSTKFSDVFWQTLDFSLGMTHGNADDEETDDSTAFTKLGLGIKFSIIRPHWSKQTATLFQQLMDAQSSFLKDAIDIDTSTKGAAIRQKMVAVQNSNLSASAKADSLNVLIQQLSAINQAYADAINNQLQDSLHFMALKNAARNFKIDRTGGFLDFAAGMALDFPTDEFEYSLTSKAGAWLTGGYENGNSGFSALGIVRYLYNPDKIFADDNGILNMANISTLDAGARLLLTALDGKFVASAEGIYRSVLNKNTIDPSWRFTFNTEYDIGANRKLTLVIGRNFDGAITQSGNLLAALNFIAGFGSAKKISSAGSN